ncbi:ORF1133 [White spot syndrome virus]|uniref:ORF1133 n=1 Tax=White spot syndrome virus TaxID=342409 RepID=A0A2D3I5Z3_9VIRU|nr:ORF1133 [White spot syndrome virus]
MNETIHGLITLFKVNTTIFIARVLVSSIGITGSLKISERALVSTKLSALFVNLRTALTIPIIILHTLANFSISVSLLYMNQL